MTSASGYHCEVCNADTKYGEHAPWCPRGDPGERPTAALIWEKLEALEQKLDRLALAVGLPPDWDDDGE